MNTEGDPFTIWNDEAAAATDHQDGGGDGDLVQTPQNYLFVGNLGQTDLKKLRYLNDQMSRGIPWPFVFVQAGAAASGSV